jgi:hypothetical protein
MSDPMIPDNPNTSSPWPRLWLNIPPGVPTPEPLIIYEVPHPEQFDRRLKGYRLEFLISEPPPDAPNRSPVVLIPLNGHPVDGWQLWRVWLHWPAAPVIGELRFEPVYGWVSATYIPQESTRSATSRDWQRITRGLEILQRRVPPLGRRKGTRRTGVGPYTDLESFLVAARRERDRLRRRRDPVEKDILARRLGMSVRNFERGLHGCQLLWEAFRDGP